MVTYAGIGSRETPGDICEIMTRFARAAAKDGAVLRTGGALGADSAFMDGCTSTEMELFLPWQGYNGHRGTLPASEAAMAMAEEVCGPVHWSRCSQGARKMHARNMQIILGKDLDDPVAFVLCWTAYGRKLGGTATGIRCAEYHGIEVFNLGVCDRLNAMAICSTLLEGIRVYS